jgi:hypothetical protein
MKIDLLDKELNLEELQEAIFRFSVLENKRPYLFMNAGTLGTLERQSDLRPLDMPVNSVICEYNGCKAYIDNSLLFGEVDLR